MKHPEIRVSASLYPFSSALRKERIEGAAFSANLNHKSKPAQPRGGHHGSTVPGYGLLLHGTHPIERDALLERGALLWNLAVVVTVQRDLCPCPRSADRRIT